MDLPKFKYFSNNSDTLDVVLHGKDVGMDAPFMKKIADACNATGHSVLTFNFPYFERGDAETSGIELKEEVETLKKLLEFVKADNYQNIRLIGKSLGGIVAGYYLKNIENLSKYSVIVFGYVTGSIDLKNFPGKITIIQGENDKFGNIEIVKNDLGNAKSNGIKYFEIKNADHSYRDPETKKPIYEDEAVKVLSEL